MISTDTTYMFLFGGESNALQSLPQMEFILLGFGRGGGGGAKINKFGKVLKFCIESGSLVRPLVGLVMIMRHDLTIRYLVSNPRTCCKVVRRSID